MEQQNKKTTLKEKNQALLATRPREWFVTVNTAMGELAEHEPVRAFIHEMVATAESPLQAGARVEKILQEDYVQAAISMLAPKEPTMKERISEMVDYVEEHGEMPPAQPKLNTTGWRERQNLPGKALTKEDVDAIVERAENSNWWEPLNG